MDFQAKQHAAQASANGKQWYYFHGDGDYRDWEPTNGMHVNGYARITFNDAEHTAWATLFNPAATPENDESTYSDECKDLTWDEAERIVNLTMEEWSGSPDPKDPDNFWIDDVTGERVNAQTGERTAA